MKTSTSTCRSKNPATCPYHGKRMNLVTINEAMDTAVRTKNLDAYTDLSSARDEIVRERSVKEGELDSAVIAARLEREQSKDRPATPQRIRVNGKTSRTSAPVATGGTVVITKPTASETTQTGTETVIINDREYTQTRAAASTLRPRDLVSGTNEEIVTVREQADFKTAWGRKHSRLVLKDTTTGKTRSVEWGRHTKVNVLRPTV